MGSIEKKFKWCLSKGSGERKHRGLRKINPDKKEAERHIDKALHNVDAMVDFSEKYPDWAVSAAFYAMYHSLLAILYKLGYESRNQECTITTIEYFIKQRVLDIDTKYILMIRSTKEIAGENAKGLREEFQYGTKTTISRIKLEILMDNTKEFVDKMRAVIM